MTGKTAFFLLLVAASLAAPKLSLSQAPAPPAATADLGALTTDPVPPAKARIMGYTVTSFPKSR